MTASNPFLDVIQQDQSNNIRQSLLTAVDKQPDTEAKLQSLADQYQLPVDAVRLEQPTVERRAKLDAVDYDSLVKRFPHTGTLLSDPNKAAVAHDDIPNLQAIEGAVQSWNGPEPTLGNVASGLWHSLSPKPMVSALKLALHDAFGGNDSVESRIYGRDLQRKALQAQAEQDNLTPDFESDTARGVYSGASSFMQSLPGLAVSVATGSPLPMLASAGANQGLPAYAKYLDRGASKGEAALGALGEGGAEVGFEALPMGFIVNKFGKVGAGEFLSGLLAREVPSEQATTLVQDAIDTAIANPDKTWSDYAAERPDAAYQTLLATLTQGGITGAIHHVAKTLADSADQVQSAHESAAKLDAVTQLAGASEVLRRSPAVMKEFLDNVTAGTGNENVYIDAKAFAQTGIAEQVAAALPGVAEQLPAALASGGEIRIPLSDYVGLVGRNESFAQTLNDHVRLEGDEFSRAQANDYMEQHGEALKAEISTALQRRSADEAFQRSMQSVKDSVKAQLDGLGRFPSAVNERYAALHGQFYGVMADKLGLTPETLYQRYGARIRAENRDNGVPAFHQVAIDDISSLKRDVSDFVQQLKQGNIKGLVSITREEADKYSDGIRIATKGTETTGLQGWFLPITTDEFADPNAGLHPQKVTYGKDANTLEDRYDDSEKADRLRLIQGRDVVEVQLAPPELGKPPETHMNVIRPGANQPDNLYQHFFQKRKGDDNTTDIFGSEISADRGETGNAETDSGSDLFRDDAPAGRYGNRTQLIRESSRELGADKVNSAAEAAQALAYLAKSTVERLDALITDKDGNPLAVVGAFKGAIASANVYPATVAGEAFRIKGAANIWFAHNHPSGIAELSDADRNMNHRLSETFRGSEITPRGIFAIGGKEGDGRKWVYQLDKASADEYGVTKAASKKQTVPVVERVYTDEGRLAEKLTGTAAAKSIATEVSNGESGVLLTDNQHVVVAFVPVKSDESLRHDGRMDALHRALSMANAAGAIIVNQGDMSVPAIENLAGFFNSNEVRVLDVMQMRNGKLESEAEKRAPSLDFSRNYFWQDKLGLFHPDSRTITLLPKANLSTFLHESGHLFLEMQMDLTAQLMKEDELVGTNDAQKQLIADTQALLDWFGLRDLNEWFNLDFEQKTSYHEKFAESFEKYLFEGKAPSLELARIFAAFREWMKRVYQNFSHHFKDVPLTDEVRAVFDRMFATDADIKLAEQARSMMPLFADAEQSGMTPEAYAAYQALWREGEESAVNQMNLKGLRDMQWLSNAKNRKLRELQRQHDDMRRSVRMEVRAEVMGRPVYQAWQFLTGKLGPDDKIVLPVADKSNPDSVDVAKDSLFVAIAKLGGLDREQLEAEWDYDQPGRARMPVFGKPLARREGGKSIEEMAELLRDHGYLSADRFDRYDLREFEEKFEDELRGRKQYSAGFNSSVFDEELKAGQHIVNPDALHYGRFDLAALKSMLDTPEPDIDRVVKLGMTSRNGLHPDMVAELFNFSSGDDLVQSLATAPKPREEIERLTDERMLQAHGELATPEARRRAVDEALHNEARARFVTSEAHALADATGEKKLLMQAAKAFAEQLIAKLKVRDLNPGQYQRAESRAAAASSSAEKAGDIKTAAAEKRNQQINFYAAREAFSAQDDIDKFVRYFKKFYTSDLKKIDFDYADEIRGLLDKYNFRQLSGAKIDKVSKLRGWVQARLAEGEVPYISETLLNAEAMAEYLAAIESRDSNGNLIYADDEEQIKLLADLIDKSSVKSYKDATVEEMRGLYDTVQTIEQLGRLKHRMLTALDKKSFEEIRDDIHAEIVDHGGKGGKNVRSANDLIGRWGQKIYSFGIAHIRVPIWIRIMDGGKDNGALWRYMLMPANERASYETGLKSDAVAALDAILRPVLAKVPVMDKVGKGRKIASIPGVSLNFMERFAVLLNVGNESNMSRLMQGGIANVAERLTPRQVMDVLETLTSDQVLAAQQVWNHFEMYRPLIEAKQKRLGIKGPLWIKARPITIKTADGQTVTLKGGYYPVVFDPRVNLMSRQNSNTQDLKDAMKAAFSAAATRRGHLETRVEELNGRPLLLNIQGLYSGVSNVIHDLAWHEWVIDMNRLLRDRSIFEAMSNYYGPTVHEEFEAWRNDIILGQTKLNHQLERWAGYLRQSVTLSALAFSVKTAMLQPIGVVNSIPRLGWKWWGQGVTKYASSPIESAREAMQFSVYLQQRTQNRFRDLHELATQMNGPSGFKEFMSRYGYWLLVRAQLLADIPTWWGGYLKALDADPNDHDLAVSLADQAVKDSQGGGETVDQSGIERGPALIKLFTAFYSFMNMTLNNVYLSYKVNKNKDAAARETAKTGVDMLLLLVVVPQLTWLLKDLLTPTVGGGDDDEVWARALKEEFSFLFGLFAGGREMGSMISNGLDNYHGPTGLRLVYDTAALAQQGWQGEFDKQFRKAFVTELGETMGLPAVQINNTWSGVQAIAEGETGNPLALGLGVRH